MVRSIFQSLSARMAADRDGPSRREVLRAGLSFSAAALTASVSPQTFFSTPKSKPQKHVVVIGAGLAGLSCAYELIRSGLHVTVLETRDRIGGRVLSSRDLVDGAVVEAGGEFIGRQHKHWLAYANQFGLPLRKMTEFDPLEQSLLIDGQRLADSDARQLFESAEKLLRRFNRLAEKIDADHPWNSPDADRLDRISVGQWLAHQEVDPMTLNLTRLQLASDNGVDVDRQSLLGLLAMIKGGGLNRYWTETEYFRCTGGNDLLAHKLADTIGHDRIKLKARVSAIHTGNGKCEVIWRDGQVFTADEIVLAIPTSTWRNIHFDPALPNDLNPQMGQALKYITRVDSRFWIDKKLSPHALTDGLLSQTWESTEGQDCRDAFTITAFTSGPQVAQSQAINPEHRVDSHLQAMNELLPGTATRSQGARFINWSQDPHTLGGYSFPSPGEITRIGQSLHDGLPNLHFAGEHCSYAFIGYMEGALESGNRIATKIIEKYR